MAYARHEPDSHRAGIIPLLTRFTLLLIVVAFLAGVALVFFPVIQRQFGERKEIERLESLIAARKAELRKEEEAARLLRSDPEYVETIARDRMDLMKEGETIFRLEVPTPEPAPQP